MVPLSQATSSILLEAFEQKAGSHDGESAPVDVNVLMKPTLTMLNDGKKDNKQLILIDKVHAMATLQAAWQQLQDNNGNYGIGGLSVERFVIKQEHYLTELQQALKDGSYQPLPVKQALISKACGDGLPVGIPAVKDRIVQIALKNVIEPIFENQFVAHSYGFRPSISCKDALRQVDEYLKAGQNWVVDADMQGLFDTILHAALMSEVEKHISDAKVLKLIYAYLKQDIMELGSSGTEIAKETVITPLLAGLYLHSLAKRMAQAGYTMVRCANDGVMQAAETCEEGTGKTLQ